MPVGAACVFERRLAWGGIDGALQLRVAATQNVRRSGEHLAVTERRTRERASYSHRQLIRHELASDRFNLPLAAS